MHTWDELKAGLIQMVHGATSDLERLMALSNMRQGAEGCCDFINRLLLQFKALSAQPTEAEKMRIILKGLNPKVAVALAANSTISTVRDMINVAMNIESILDRNRALAAVEERGPDATEAASMTEVDINAVRFGTKATGSGNRGQNRGRSNQAARQLHCFRCGRQGHASPDCSKPQEPGLKCWGCGADGVRRRECPTCQPKN